MEKGFLYINMVVTEQCLQMPWSFLSALTHYQTTKILDVTKLKAVAHNKLNVARMTISLLDREENTVGKGENTGYQHFLLFLRCHRYLSHSHTMTPFDALGKQAF